MAALTREWPRTVGTEQVSRAKMEIGAGVKIWKGADVVVDTRTGSATRGYLIPAGTQTTVSATTNSTGQLARGRARATVDNTTGANGAAVVEVDLLRPVYLKHVENSGSSAVAKGDRGSSVYYEDDHTVGTSSSGTSSAGRAWDVDSAAGTVAVEVTA